MTIFELSKRLQEARVPSTIYNLSGGLPSEKHCIAKQNESEIWEVYYSERGNKSSLKTFNTEEEACNYFYYWVFKTAQNMKLV